MSLDTKCLLSVFVWLESKELCRCAKVSKKWNLIADDENLWKDLVKRDFLNHNSPTIRQNKKRKNKTIENDNHLKKFSWKENYASKKIEIQTGIVHEIDKNQFSITFNNGEQALLQYEEIEPGKYDFYHTFTPPAYRGQGIAAKLSTEALHWIIRNKWKVLLSCSYLDSTFENDDRYKTYLIPK